MEIRAPARATMVKGKANYRANKKLKWKALKAKAPLQQGAEIRTGPKTRVELTFLDGSVIRLGPNSRVTLTQGLFTKKNKRQAVSLRLWVGRVWANVIKATSAPTKFEVHTDNAVSGVRGTSFAVFAAADASAIVRVYAGSVGVRPALGESANRRRVPGPQRVDKAQWNEMVATALKQIRVSTAGDIAPAEDFEDDKSADDWASWNKKQDAR